MAMESCTSSFLALLLLSFLFASYTVSAEVISLMSDDVACLEATVTFTCNVSGTSLGWRYNGSSVRVYFSPSGPNSLSMLGSGPFNTRVTSVSGGVITSIATATNLTRDANGLTLECSDGLFTSSNTDIESTELNLREFIPPSFVGLSNSDTTIFNILSINECNPMRSTDVFYETNKLRTINESVLLSYKPPGPGLYTFNVSNLDVNQQSIASNSFNFSWNNFTFAVDHSVYYTINSAIILITIRAPPMNQPKMLACELSLMRYNNSYISPTSCFNNKVFNFTDVPVGNYTYVVTITNALGPSSRSGFVIVEEVVRPTATTSPTIVSSSSSEFFSSLTPSLSPTSSSTPTSTSPPSEQKNTTNTIAFAIALGLSGLWCILSILWCILHLCWRHCFCCLALWTLSIWRYVFCECFRKESKSDANIVPKNESKL